MPHEKRIVVMISGKLGLNDAVNFARKLGDVVPMNQILFLRKTTSQGKFFYIVCRTRNDRGERIKDHTVQVKNADLLILKDMVDRGLPAHDEWQGGAGQDYYPLKKVQ